MIVRSSRVLLLFFAAALVGLALIFGVLILQLNRGPISLSFLTPLVERALNSVGTGTVINLHDTVLTWDAEERELDIRATGLRFFDADNKLRATIPEMNVTFSARALLRGLIAPTNLEVFGPRLRIVRRMDGDMSVDFGAENGESDGDTAPVELVQELLRAPDLSLASGYLSGVSVRSAFVEFLDEQTGRRLVAPRANISLVRDDAGIRADATIVVGEGELGIRLGLSGIYHASTGTTDLGVVFGDVSPATVVQFDEVLKPLERLNAKLEGTVTLELDSDFNPSVASVDLRAGAGTLDAAPLFAEPVAFESASMRLSGDQLRESVTVETFEVAVGPTKIVVTGSGQRIGAEWTISLEAEMRDLPVNDIGKFWPSTVEPNARDWITENIRDGHINMATLRVRAQVPEADPADFFVDDIGGEVRFRDATVHYLRPMEPVTNGAGVARVDARQVVVDVQNANLRGIVGESGRIVIDGLNGPSRGETIKIEATVAGPVRDALEVLDSEPLGFISGFGIDPKRTSGTQRTNVVFAFPLLNEIKVEEIAVATSSRLVKFSAAEAAFGFPISSGDLSLNVNRDGLEARGTAEVGSIPIGLTWVEKFNEATELRTRYEVRTVLGEAAREKLALETAPFVTGPVGVGLTYSVGWDGTAAGAAEIDLTDASLSLEPFGWTKRNGVPGRAFVRFDLPDEKSLTLQEFQVEAGDLDLAGNVIFENSDSGFDIRQLRLDRLKFGGNDVVVNVEFPDNVPPVIALSGNAVDLRPVMGDLFDDDDPDAGGGPAMRILISDKSPIESVRLGEETHLLNARGTVVNNGVDWTEAQLRGKLSNAGRVVVRLEPEPDLLRLTFETDDAGGLLGALDWVDTIEGGDMRIRATIMGGDPDQVISGQVDMQGFVLTEEPFAAKLLALASFSGIGDVLSGQGITFRRAEVPFRMTDNEIVIKGAKARGAEIGIIINGKIDRNAETLKMEGEVAPAYTLNSLLANIPLIGQVLSGGSEGIFAATFAVNGTLSEPEVSVNPLSVLTPGIIRKLLSGFDSDAELPDTLPQADPEAPDVGQ